MSIVNVPPTKNSGQKSLVRSLHFISTHDGCGLYGIQNVASGKIYVGQSIRMLNRIREHKWKLAKGTHDNVYLQRAYNKYGKDNFIFYVLCYCEPTVLDLYETNLIASYRSHNKMFGYNLELGGNGKSKLISEETRKKQSDSHKGKVGSRIGSKWSDEQIKIGSLASQGVKRALGRSSSVYVGVCWHKNKHNWQANLCHNGKKYYIGSFLRELDAALAYNTKAVSLLGIGARLNIIGSYE